MKVHVKLFGMIAADIGYKEREYDIDDGCTVHDLLSGIKLPDGTTGVVVTVNGEIRGEDNILKDNDELLVLPIGEEANAG
jgi:sulfur carrier protein ThiS